MSQASTELSLVQAEVKTPLATTATEDTIQATVDSPATLDPSIVESIEDVSAAKEVAAEADSTSFESGSPVEVVTAPAVVSFVEPENLAANTEPETKNVEETLPHVKPRVYLKNLAYDTTEEELESLFSLYNVVSVLIPTYTVRGFRFQKYKPLGIAYADFKSHEDVANVIKELHNTEFNKRKLVIRPYHPNPYQKRQPKSQEIRLIAEPEVIEKESESKTAENESETVEAAKGTGSASQPEEPSKDSVGETSKSNSGPEIANDMIYLSRVSHKITISELRSFFKEYNPEQIYLYETKTSYRGRKALSLSGRFRSALIKLKCDESVSEVIESLRSNKLRGRSVILRTAYAEKVEEVLKAANSKDYTFVSELSPNVIEEHN